MPAETRGLGWYRIKFNLAQSPSALHTVGITHPRAFRTTFFVNGKVVGGAGDLIAGSRRTARSTREYQGPDFGTPLHVTVPPALLRAGENTIHVRVNAASTDVLMHGLPTVIFGEATVLRTKYMASTELGFGAQRGFFALALVGGLITLLLWLARRDDKVLFWYSAACLLWSIVSIPRLGLRWTDFFLPALPVLVWFLKYGLVVPVVVMCLRTVELRWPRFEAALWVFLVLETTFPLWATGSIGRWYLAWDAVNSVLLLGGAFIILARMKPPLRWAITLQIAALLLMAALMFVEVMRYLGWIDVDFKAIRHYHVPLMLLAIGAVIFERHVLAVRRTEKANLELEQRVAERAREMEANYARVEEATREQALARERERILADMHDGLGASLLGLLRRVQLGGGDHAGVERRVREALLEMRVAVDALRPRESDIASLLGNMRYRFEEVIGPTDVHLIWQVGELPPVNGLGPSKVFELQRILLEAVTNALKHSGARQVKFSAQAHGRNRISIEVRDDGRGFDASQSAAGLGLASMRARASRIGAALDIRSHQGTGTTVEITLPTALPDTVYSASAGEPEWEGVPQGTAMPARAAS